MPRALAIFKNAGLPVIPSSTDVRGTFPADFTVLDLLPDSEALDKTTRAMKEWVGRAAFEVGLQR
jgi:uncharacterized SAM-binding protein YcdF (DUF218 family)